MGDGGVEQRLSRGHRAHRRHQFPGWGVLQQEPAGTGPQRGEDVLVGIEGGQHDDPGGAAGRDQPAQRLDPVEVGHAHVHQHDVGLRVLDHLYRGQTVSGFTHHLDVGFLVQDHGEAGTDEVLVVDDHDADAHVGS